MGPRRLQTALLFFLTARGQCTLTLAWLGAYGAPADCEDVDGDGACDVDDDYDETDEEKAAADEDSTKDDDYDETDAEKAAADKDKDDDYE